MKRLLWLAFLAVSVVSAPFLSAAPAQPQAAAPEQAVGQSVYLHTTQKFLRLIQARYLAAEKATAPQLTYAAILGMAEDFGESVRQAVEARYLTPRSSSPRPLPDRHYLALLEEAFIFLAKQAPGPQPEKTLFYAALSAMVESLADPYSSFLQPEAAKQFVQQRSGNYVGIGVFIAQGKQGQLLIAEVVEASPAWAVGLKSGDQLLSVNGASLVGKTLQAVQALILGAPNSEVRLSIARKKAAATSRTKGLAARYTYTIKRQPVLLKSLTPQSVLWRGRSYAYLRVPFFSAATTAEFKQALKKFTQARTSGLVVDLRNNPGGLLQAVVELVGFFVGEQVVVYLQARKGAPRYFRSGRERHFPLFLPVVVLVNGYSASAAEIFSGALRYYGRAVVVGERTFGKFSAQEEFADSATASLLKLTIANYYFPDGTSYPKIGLPPQLEVKSTYVVPPTSAVFQYDPKDLVLTQALELLAEKKSYQNYLKK